MIKSTVLEIAGPGFIFCSPFSTAGIAEGEDFLASGFEDPGQVEEQALAGRIVGVSTGSPGSYIFDLYEGGPSVDILQKYRYKLRLGVEVRDGLLQLRDLYDLMDWNANCPKEQLVELKSGFYRITLLSEDPESGILGDDQKIIVYLELVDEMPKLKIHGVPTLC